MRENKNDRKQGKSERKKNDSREGKKHHASICIRNVPFIFCSCKVFFRPTFKFFIFFSRKQFQPNFGSIESTTEMRLLVIKKYN
jgi:hypothetical protein